MTLAAYKTAIRTEIRKQTEIGNLPAALRLVDELKEKILLQKY